MTPFLPAAKRAELVAFANQAPSVHNTQPARWHFADDGAVWILSDRTRHLAVGDPHLRDAGLSCGAALEATVLGLSQMGICVRHIELMWGQDEASPVKGHTPAARIELATGAAPMPLAGHIPGRFTWRGGFAASTDSMARDLAHCASNRADLTLVHEKSDIAALAEFNDRASLSFLRRPGYRAELMAWMRLRPSHGSWNNDGLNAEALGMSRIEAIGAGFVLDAPQFEWLDRLGLARPLVSESSKTKSSGAIGLFHRPRGESPVATGRAYLEILLNLTRLGLQAWPMAVVADESEVAAEVSDRYCLPEDHRLVNVLRIGVVPTGRRPRQCRLEPSRLFAS